MIAITCAAKNGAILFNKRRCSKDREVISDIIATFGEDIRVTSFSRDLFEGYGVSTVTVNELCDDDIFFFEDIPFNEFSKKVSRLIVYRWDRVYPAGLSLEIDNSFKLIEKTEIMGYSHDKIIREVYSR